MGKNVYHITEKDQYMPPSSMGLISIADSIGTRLMNMYNEIENLKVSYPDSESKCTSFIDSSILPLNDKIKSVIQTEIPKLETITVSKYNGDTSTYKDLGYLVKTIKDKSTVDLLLKLKGFEKEVSDLEKKSEEIKSSISSLHKGSDASKSYEDAVKAIIDKVRAGIEKQAEQNIRNKKRGDIIAGTTDVNSVKGSRASGTEGSTSNEVIALKKKKNIDNISSYLAKKYGS
jgi:chaperonin cofactor prefoldin